jgi:hypothetical protein
MEAVQIITLIALGILGLFVLIDLMIVIAECKEKQRKKIEKRVTNIVDKIR